MDRWLLRMDLSKYTQPYEFQRLNTLEQILLAQSIDSSEIAVWNVARAALQPNDPQRFIQLFKV